MIKSAKPVEKGKPFTTIFPGSVSSLHGKTYELFKFVDCPHAKKVTTLMGWNGFPFTVIFICTSHESLNTEQIIVNGSIRRFFASVHPFATGKLKGTGTCIALPGRVGTKKVLEFPQHINEINVALADLRTYGKKTESSATEWLLTVAQTLHKKIDQIRQLPNGTKFIIDGGKKYFPLTKKDSHEYHDFMVVLFNSSDNAKPPKNWIWLPQKYEEQTQKIVSEKQIYRSIDIINQLSDSIVKFNEPIEESEAIKYQIRFITPNNTTRGFNQAGSVALVQTIS